jgi:hypothetical protein
LTEVNERSRLTDSPWYWVLVFSLMALAALAAISGKYGKRQAGIERQYQARERIAEKKAAENNSTGASRIDDQETRRPFATPGEQLIPLWPLAVLLSLVAIVAATMLLRASRAVRGPDNNTTPA